MMSSNPAKKYYKALSKLEDWVQKTNPRMMTYGLDTFREHLRTGAYPGLGTVTKLAIMHHLELMNVFVERIQS